MHLASSSSGKQFFPKLYIFSNFCPIMHIGCRAKVIGKSVIKFANQKRIHIRMRQKDKFNIIEHPGISQRTLFLATDVIIHVLSSSYIVSK